MILSRRIVILCFALAIACRPAGQTPGVRHGQIDLRGFNAEDVVIPLDGDWEFYWDQTERARTEPPEFLPVPGSWVDRGVHPPAGKAVYRLRVLSNQTGRVFALKIYEFPEAYRLYINGEKVLENGKYAEDPAQSARTLVRPVVTFPLKETNDIIFEVVNLNEDEPGPRRSILLGTERAIRGVQENQIITDMITCGVLLIMGLYHLALYYQRRKENGAFVFGLYCLIMAFRLLVTEEHYLHKYFPGFPGWLEQRLDVMSFFILPPVIAGIFSNFFRRDFHPNLLRFIVWPCATLMAIYCIFPNRLIFETYILLSLVIGIYLGYVLVLGVRRSRRGALLFLVGWLIYLGTAILDFLSFNNIVRTIYVSHIGFLFFVFSQAYFLSLRFNRALATAEELSERLELRVRERTRELNHSLEIIQKDLAMAREVQESLLKRKGPGYPGLVIVEKYIPFSEVGGDIYDIRETAPGKVRIFVADANGHGVQAALITVMIKSEYDSLNQAQLRPAEIIESFNRSYTDSRRSYVSMFSCFILDLDFEHRTIEYSSGGHPAQMLLRAGEILRLKPGGPMIGIKGNARFGHGVLPLLPGDRFLIFTDGIFEEFNDRKEIFGEERLWASVGALSHQGMSELTVSLLAEVQSFLGNAKWDDDTTILGIEVRIPET